MAILLNQDRILIWAKFMQENNDSFGLIKPDLRAAVNAIDDWIDANVASFNSALPLPARTTLLARQKARLLMMVILRRFEVS